jgi:hypothetical protein
VLAAPFDSVLGEWNVNWVARRVRAVLLLVLVLLASLPARPAVCQEVHRTTPDLSQVAGQSSWLWVVPRLELSSASGLSLSAFYSGLGPLDLDLILVDRAGDVVSRTRWQLVADHPTDYRLQAPSGLSPDAPLSLVSRSSRSEPGVAAPSFEEAGCKGTSPGFRAPRRASSSG